MVLDFYKTFQPNPQMCGISKINNNDFKRYIDNDTVTKPIFSNNHCNIIVTNSKKIRTSEIESRPQ